MAVEFVKIRSPFGGEGSCPRRALDHYLAKGYTVIGDEPTAGTATTAEHAGTAPSAESKPLRTRPARKRPARKRTAKKQ